MQTEDRYDDLSTLFESQDEVLQSEGFVDHVMDKVQRRSLWRAPLLFGAGGLGIGAAISQISGLAGILQVPAPDLTLSLQGIQTTQVSMDAQSMMMAAAVIVVLSCAAMVMSEKA